VSNKPPRYISSKPKNCAGYYKILDFHKNSWLPQKMGIQYHLSKTIQSQP